MKSLRIILIVVAVFCWAKNGYAFYGSTCSLSGTGIPNQTDGGVNIGAVTLEDTGYFYGSDYTQTFYGICESSALNGTVGLGLYGTTSVDTDAPSIRYGPTGSTIAVMRDEFIISSGSSGLSDGSPVQVRLQASLNGSIVLHGTPSGASSIPYFKVVTETGSVVDWSWGMQSPEGYPPENSTINQFWDILVDTTVGSNLFFTTSMRLDLGSSGHSPGTTQTNYLDFLGSGIMRISHAPGFEDISIVSEAGAPITVIPEPISSILFVAGGTLLAGRCFFKKRRNC